MKKFNASIAVALAVLGLSGMAAAHHSFAPFDLTKQVLIEGHVTAWQFNNPHSWLYIDALDENGVKQQWGFEGAAPVHLMRAGVNGTTFHFGDALRIVASPSRDGRHAGAICFVVREDGTFIEPNDGVCNAAATIEKWKANGWLANGKHLDVHLVER